MFNGVPHIVMLIATMFSLAGIFAAWANIEAKKKEKPKLLITVQYMMLVTITMFFSVEAIITIDCYTKTPVNLNLILWLSIIAIGWASATKIVYYLGFVVRGNDIDQTIKTAKENKL